MARVNRHERAMSEPQGWARPQADFDREPTESFSPCLLSRFVGAIAIVLAIALLAATHQPLGDSPVADAAQVGDVETVRTLLRQGADVNAAQGDGMTALHWSAYRGELELVQVLVYAGANLEASTRVGDHTPLLIAARTGHGDAVEALVEAGADPTARTSTGVTALHFAAGSGQVAAVEALIAAGADFEAREEAQGQTPLVFAASRGRVEAIRALTAAGADPNASTRVTMISRLEAEDRIDARLRRERLEAQAALREAEARARLEMDELTAPEDGTEEANASEGSETPDDAAAEQGGEESEEDAPPAEGDAAEGDEESDDSTEPESDSDSDSDEEEDAEAEEAPTPDRDAQTGPPPETPEAEGPMEEPLGYGDLVGGVGGLSPLHHAAREGHFEAAMALLDAGADIDRPTGGDSSSPMLLATINGHFDLALALMERGADPDLGSHADVTPLWAAINVNWAPKALYPQPKSHQRQQVDYLEFMERLLEAGVDPNRQVNRHIWFLSYNFDLLGVNMRGSSPFWRAAYALDVPAMRLLVAHGADPHLPSTKPPERRRRSWNAEEDEDQSGLPPIPVGGPGVYPIHAASGAGYGQDFAANSHEHAPDGWLPAVRYLVEELGADVNARDQFGYNAIHHAAARGDNELILYLVEQGADPLAIARNGRTTVDMANGPIQRVEPFPETIALLEGMGAKNNHNCLSCE